MSIIQLPILDYVERIRPHFYSPDLIPEQAGINLNLDEFDFVKDRRTLVISSILIW